MYMEYWVDLGIKIWKNGRKTHILGIFGGPVLVPNRPVPVQVVFCFFVLTNVRILAITCSFLIRFE